MKSKIRRSRIASAIADKVLAQGTSPELGREIAAFLLSERRTSELESILRDVQVDWAVAGFVEVVATSAFPLDDTTKTDIMSLVRPLYPEAEQIIITEAHDESLIGGVQISVAGQELDLSIEAKLDKFKQLTVA